MARQLRKPELKDDIRVVEICGVHYYIYWEDLPIGGSFFLPTTVRPKEVMAQLRPVADKLNYGLEARTRTEYGRYGVRVWRVL